jgi:hypothetical protein
MGSVPAGGDDTLSFSFGTQSRFTHQPSHSFARDALPLIFQLGMQARASISALMGGKDLPNLGAELSIFSLALAGRALSPCIKATL